MSLVKYIFGIRRIVAWIYSRSCRRKRCFTIFHPQTGLGRRS